MEIKFTRLPYLIFIFFLLFNACKKEDSPDPSPPKLNPEDCPNTEMELNVVEELNANYSHVFSGAEPAEDDPSLMPLIDYLGDAKLVGLGEGTHGTSEFYKMKDKIFRQLVMKKNFKAIVFEIPWGNALKVNDFVTKGEGNAQEVIDQTYYWTYNTQEVEDLAQWVHDYNLNLNNGEKIFFVGCDPKGGDFNIEENAVAAFLNIVQPDSVSAVISNYANLPYNDLSDYSEADPGIHQKNINGSKKVFDYLEQRREEFIAATSLLEFEIAHMASHVIQHREYIYRTDNYGWARDSLMAVYSEWWQRILAPDAKVAIWAHNNHVMNAAYFNANWMGTYLRQRNQADYKIVGFSFGLGSFNAFLAGSNREFVSAVRKQSVPEYQCNTINQLLSRADGGQHYIIFDEIPAGSTESFFDDEQRFLQFGAGFNYNYVHKYIVNLRLHRIYDVLVHFDETEASVF